MGDGFLPWTVWSIESPGKPNWFAHFFCCKCPPNKSFNLGSFNKNDSWGFLITQLATYSVPPNDSIPKGITPACILHAFCDFCVLLPPYQRHWTYQLYLNLGNSFKGFQMVSKPLVRAGYLWVSWGDRWSAPHVAPAIGPKQPRLPGYLRTTQRWWEVGGWI